MRSLLCVAAVVVLADSYDAAGTRTETYVAPIPVGPTRAMATKTMTYTAQTSATSATAPAAPATPNPAATTTAAPTSTTGFTKRTQTTCTTFLDYDDVGGFYRYHYTLTSAETACNANSACYGVHDYGCDDVGSFYLCAAWSTSGASCVWEKTHGATTPATAPAATFAATAPAATSAATAPATGFTKRTQTYCGGASISSTGGENSYGGYYTMTSAETACNATSTCYGVYDFGCDDSGTFYLCTGAPSTWSTSGTLVCVWEKTHGATTPTTTSAATAPAATSAAPTTTAAPAPTRDHDATHSAAADSSANDNGAAISTVMVAMFSCALAIFALM